MTDKLKNIVSEDLCISCGACSGIVDDRATLMSECIRQAVSSPMPVVDDALARHICPGTGYDIVKLSQELYGDAENHDPELGYWRTMSCARSTDETLLNNASSGAIMTAVADHLLRTGEVDGVVTTRMKYGRPGPRAEGFIARNTEDLLSGQGSKYGPVPLLKLLPDMERLGTPLAFIGTPCQIAVVRLLQKKRCRWNNIIKYTIGNFCGGFRPWQATDTIIRRSRFDPPTVTFFRFRGGGQPGSLKIEDHAGNSVTLPYPEYTRRAGTIKSYRCRTCVDATAELADFACGDAWIPRFLNSDKAWSVAIGRSVAAKEVLADMISMGLLETAQVTLEEVRNSQHDNLLSKKRRQDARRRFYCKLGYPLPRFDGGFEQTRGGELFELKVYASHTILALLERLGLYPTIARLIKRYR